MLLLPRPLTILAATLTLIALSGCKTTQTADQKTSKADGEEYVYVQETGSRIPVKVKKSKGQSDATNLEKGDQRNLEQMQRDQTLRTMRRDGS